MTDVLGKYALLDPALQQRQLNDVLAAAGGPWTKISSGTISSPVAYFDVAIPDGYGHFEIVLSDLSVSSGQATVCAVSLDGDTFISDATNFDTYGSMGLITDTGQSGSRPVSGTANGSLSFHSAWGQDSIMGITYGTPVAEYLTKLSFTPGSSTKSFIMRTQSYSIGWDNDSARSSSAESVWFFNPDATSPISLARISKIRFASYGNEDIDPPTSDDTITGSWALYGLT